MLLDDIVFDRNLLRYSGLCKGKDVLLFIDRFPIDNDTLEEICRLFCVKAILSGEVLCAGQNVDFFDISLPAIPEASYVIILETAAKRMDFLSELFMQAGFDTEHILCGFSEYETLMKISDVWRFQHKMSDGSAQYNEASFLRYAIVVRYLFVEQFFGLNDYGSRIYAQYVLAKKRGDPHERAKQFRETIISVTKHRRDDLWIALDKNGNILDGSHRLSICTFLNPDDTVRVRVFNCSECMNSDIRWLHSTYPENDCLIVTEKYRDICRKLRINQE